MPDITGVTLKLGRPQTDKRRSRSIRLQSVACKGIFSNPPLDTLPDGSWVMGHVRGGPPIEWLSHIPKKEYAGADIFLLVTQD